MTSPPKTVPKEYWYELSASYCSSYFEQLLIKLPMGDDDEGGDERWVRDNNMDIDGRKPIMGRVKSEHVEPMAVDTKPGDSARGMDAFSDMKASHSGIAKDEPVKMEQESLNKPVIKSDPSFEMN